MNHSRAHGEGRPGPDARLETAQCSAQQKQMQILPLYREFIAHFTGKWPEGGYRPRWHRPRWWHLLTMLMSLVGGVTASHVILSGPPVVWLLLVLSSMLTVHSCRKAQLVIIHYAVHGNLTGHKWCDRILSELLSTLLLIDHFEGYFKDHVRVHHGLRLATLEDADMQFILALGFRPGMSRKALWRHLYWTIISPHFHWLFLRTRLRVNCIAAPPYRRLMSSVYAAAVVCGLIITQAWVPFVIAWLIPVVPLCQISALLQFVSKHCWGLGGQTTNTLNKKE